MRFTTSSLSLTMLLSLSLKQKNFFAQKATARCCCCCLARRLSESRLSSALALLEFQFAYNIMGAACLDLDLAHLFCAQRLPGTFLGESCFPFSLAAARPRLPRAQSGIIISYFDLLFCLLFCNTFAAATAAADSLSFHFFFSSFFWQCPSFVILAADPDCALCGFLRFAPFAIIMQILFNGFCADFAELKRIKLMVKLFGVALIT